MAEPIHLNIENFCCIAKASIPLEKRGLVLITGDNQDTDAANNNGSGKTTIPKALTWCLLGDTLDGDKYDEVIRWGAKRAQVESVLKDGKDMWVVRRWRTKGKPGLSLDVIRTKKRGQHYKTIAEEPWDGSPKEIQAKIIDLLGRDFRAFCNTTLFGQGDINRFFSSPNQFKSETLHRIMRTDIYRRAEKRLREKETKALNVEVFGLEDSVRTTVAKIGEYDLGELERLDATWENDRDERANAELLSAQALIQEAREVDEATKTRRDDLEREVKWLQAEVNKITKLEAELEESHARHSKLTGEAAKLHARYRELSIEVKGAKESLSHLEGDECPLCTALLSKGAPAKHIKELGEKAERLGSQAASVRVDHDQLNRKIETNSKRGMEIRRQLEAGRGVRPGLSRTEAALARVNIECEQKKEQFKERAKTRLVRANEIQGEKNPHEARLETARLRIKELGKERDKTLAELKSKRTDLAHYEFWVRGFSPQGLPSLLLDSVMPYLTERTNYHLRTLTDGDITVEYSTQKELKSKKGELRDEITCECTIEGVPGVKPSDGQRKKLEIASDLALMDLSATREHDLGLLIADEMLDGLDAEGEARVIRKLRELRSHRSSVFVVTHEADLAESFERILHVTKKDKASTITEVK